SLVADDHKGLQQGAPLDHRNAGQITILPAQQIEDVVLNPSRFRAEILQQIEVRTATLIDGNYFSINDGSLGQIRQRLHDVRKLSMEGFFPPREQRQTSSRLHRKGAISVELNFFCGVRRYVALILIGE